MIPPLAIYGFVFLWLAAESCGLPLPNELVLLLAGSLAAQRHDWWEIVALTLVATLGSLLGASAAYAIGLRGGRGAVVHFGRYIGLDEHRLDSVERWFERSGQVAIGLSRITPFVRTVASFPAGVLRMPLRLFLGATFFGSLIWCAVMVGLGYVLGKNYDIALRLIEQDTIPAIVVIVLLFVGYLWLHNRLSHIGESSSGADTKKAQPSAIVSTPLRIQTDSRPSTGSNSARNPSRPSQATSRPNNTSGANTGRSRRKRR
ncbi:MAG: DedA family protein [Ktedonobacterales bacterium]